MTDEVCETSMEMESELFCEHLSAGAESISIAAGRYECREQVAITPGEGVP